MLPVTLKGNGLPDAEQCPHHYLSQPHRVEQLGMGAIFSI